MFQCQHIASTSARLRAEVRAFLPTRYYGHNVQRRGTITAERRGFRGNVVPARRTCGRTVAWGGELAPRARLRARGARNNVRIHEVERIDDRPLGILSV